MCVSACAYAFVMGGVNRSLGTDAKLGLHRFYFRNVLEASTSNIVAGKELDEAQKIAAGLLIYILNWCLSRVTALAVGRLAQRRLDG